MWNIWTDVKPLPWLRFRLCPFLSLGRESFFVFFVFSRGTRPSMYCVRWSNEAATVHADITADHRDVPEASIFAVFRQWQPAKPRTGMSFFHQFSNQISTWGPLFDVTSMCVRFSQSVREVNFASSLSFFWFFLESAHQLVPVRFNWGVFAR